MNWFNAFYLLPFQTDIIGKLVVIAFIILNGMVSLKVTEFWFLIHYYQVNILETQERKGRCSGFVRFAGLLLSVDSFDGEMELVNDMKFVAYVMM